MNIPNLEDFIQYVRDYLESSGEAHTTLGRRALGDPASISRLLHKGNTPRLTTAYKISKAIEERNDG